MKRLIPIMIIGALVVLAGSALATTLEGQFLSGTGAAARASGAVAIEDTLGQFAAGVSAFGDTEILHGCWHKDQSILAAKQELPGGTRVELRGKIVSAGTEVFGPAFYIQERYAAGIKVVWTAGPVLTGATVYVVGILRTDSDYERYVDAYYVGVLGSTTAQPMAMPNASVGGHDTPGYDPLAGKGQRGVKHGTGLINNIGLLVKTYGTVTVVGSDFFYIYDQTEAQDDSIFVGIRVQCGSMSKPSAGQHVSVVGISSMMKLQGTLYRCIRPRTASDIQVHPQ